MQICQPVRIAPFSEIQMFHLILNKSCITLTISVSRTNSTVPPQKKSHLEARPCLLYVVGVAESDSC